MAHQSAFKYHIKCLFYHIPDHCSCHRMSWHTQAPYAIVPCSDTIKKYLCSKIMLYTTDQCSTTISNFVRSTIQRVPHFLKHCKTSIRQCLLPECNYITSCNVIRCSSLIDTPMVLEVHNIKLQQHYVHSSVALCELIKHSWHTCPLTFFQYMLWCPNSHVFSLPVVCFT